MKTKNKGGLQCSAFNRAYISVFTWSEAATGGVL